MREEGLEPQVCLTVPLLVGLDGHEKMSKSLGNAIAVEDPPREIYGKTMSIPDALMWEWLLLLTDTPATDIARQKAEVDKGELHPMKVKKALARALVTQFHDTAAASDSEAEFERVFGNRGTPDDIPEMEIFEPHTDLLWAIREVPLVSSMNEARRMLKQGAIAIDGEVVAEATSPIRLEPRHEPYLIRVGKRRFARIRVRRGPSLEAY
jgi:tyrosyl-tRNA synthetase